MTIIELLLIIKGDFLMLDKIALTLAIIGGINWGSVGLFEFDIVAWLFGGQTAILSKIVYILVALASLWCITMLFREDEEFEPADHDMMNHH